MKQQRYAGFEMPEVAPPEPDETAVALAAAERENKELRTKLRNLERVLGAAGRVLAPYTRRLGPL